jgi:subtilisin family serine protease
MASSRRTSWAHFQSPARDLFALCLLFGLVLVTSPGLSQIPTASSYRQDQILIQPRPGISPPALSAFHASQHCKILRTFPAIRGLQVVQVPEGETVPGLIAKYQNSGLVEFAEPDYLGHTFATVPNDPRYSDGTLWGLNNTGASGGTPHADIHAAEGWDVLTSASNIVVAVLDTGIRYTHEDLAANMWVNPNDGSHGTNAVAGTTDPSDDTQDGHGTMVAGVLGGVGNNGKGVTGVAWRVQIMACKCINSLYFGSVSDTAACFDYARANGAKIINASIGFTNSLSMSNAVLAARDAGIIVVAACGNSSTNVDISPTFPACYSFDNVVSVAATTRNDTLASFSNYGLTNVHLAAPGYQIYSTFVATDNFYHTEDGTSFSAPYVSGALALMLVKFPAETHQQIISRLLNGTDPLPTLAGKCVTGGRLNLRKALSPPIQLTVLSPTNDAVFRLRVSAGPNRACMVQSSTNLLAWTSIFTNTTGPDGTFEFDDPQPASAPQKFYRVLASL